MLLGLGFEFERGQSLLRWRLSECCPPSPSTAVLSSALSVPAGPSSCRDSRVLNNLFAPALGVDSAEWLVWEEALRSLDLPRACVLLAVSHDLPADLI